MVPRRMLTLAVSVGTVLVHAAPCMGAGRAPIQKIDSGDTAWMLTSSALVLMMTAPGSRSSTAAWCVSKNVLNLLMQSFVLIALDQRAVGALGLHARLRAGHRAASIGGLAHLGLRGVGVEPDADYAPTIPHQLFMVYQMMFAIITPALITGAFAERMKFSAFVVFIAAVGDARLRPARALGVGRRAASARTLGRARLRRRHGRAHQLGHVGAGVRARPRQAARLSAPSRCRRTTCRSRVIGAALLWFGWFGFNAGSALAAERARRVAPSSRPTPRPRRRRSAGCWSSGCSRGKATRARRAPAARSRAWSRSRRRRASSRRWRRS